MRTREEIEQWLADNLPNGPETSEQQGIQDALDWVLGTSATLEA